MSQRVKPPYIAASRRHDSNIIINTSADTINKSKLKKSNNIVNTDSPINNANANANTNTNSTSSNIINIDKDSEDSSNNNDDSNRKTSPHTNNMINNTAEFPTARKEALPLW